MKFKHLAWGLALLGSLLSCASTNESANSNVMEESDYIFQGKVLNDPPIEMAEAFSGKTVKMVAVNQVLLSSSGHEDFERNKVQVVLDKGMDYETGTDLIFYTKTWLFGKTLTVIAREVRTEKDMEGVKKEVTDFQTRQDQESLRARLEAAQLVVAGQVIATAEMDEQKPGPDTEHDPMWRTARVKIDEVIKGDSNGEEVVVYYSTSRDVQWYQAPKLSEGQQGIFLLSRKERFPQVGRNYALTEAREYLPISQLNTVKELLDKN